MRLIARNYPPIRSFLHFPFTARLLRGSLALFLLLVLSFAGCKGKGSDGTESAQAGTSGGSHDFLQSELAKKLPATTYGFLHWDATSEAADEYNTYIKKTYGADYNLKDSLNSLLQLEGGAQQGSAGKVDVIEVVHFLIENGFVPFASSKAPVVEQGLSFVELKDDLPLPGFAAYLTVKKGADVDAKLKELRALLEKKQVKTSDIQGPFSYGYSFTISTGGSGGAIPKAGDEKDIQQGEAGATSPKAQAQDGQTGEVQMLVASDGKYLSLASSQQLLHRAFTPADQLTDSAADTIRQSAGYQKVRGSYGDKGEILFGYLDVERLGKRVASLIPEQEQSDLPVKLEDLPMQAASLQITYSDAVSTNFGVVVNDGKLAETKWLNTALHGNSDALAKVASTLSTSSFQAAPKDAVFYLGLSGNLLQASHTLAEEHLTEQDKVQYADSLKQLQNLRGVGIGLLPSDGSSVFPGLFLSFSTGEEQSGIISTIKESFTGLLKSQGLPATAWQQKNLDGLPVDYFLTPIGVGVYVAADESRLLLSSSESALKRLVTTRKQEQESLFASLPSDVQKSLQSGASPLLVTYFNGERSVDLIKSVTASFAMFTGGQDLVPAEQLEDIRKMGTNYSLASYDKGLLNFAGISYPPSEKAAQ